MTRAKLLIALATLAALAQMAVADGSKRIPAGFMGMRGKKSLDEEPLPPHQASGGYPLSVDDGLSAYLETLPLSSYYYHRQREQRPASSGPDWPLLAWAAAKRAPKMGFQGMRGKRPTGGLGLYESGLFYDDEDEELNGGIDAESVGLDDGDDGDLFESKRAPKMGFQGMRGKRAMATMGFQGMRGKRDEEATSLTQEHVRTEAPPPTDSSSIQQTSSSEESHEAGHEHDEYEGDDADDPARRSRRAASSGVLGFYGVRGKKMPLASQASGFFGMRGKKGPYSYPFRGKFVGVRGKKRYLAYDEPADKRKGPSGFLGMRGKKWAPSEMQLNTGLED